MALRHYAGTLNLSFILASQRRMSPKHPFLARQSLGRYRLSYRVVFGPWNRVLGEQGYSRRNAEWQARHWKEIICSASIVAFQSAAVG